MGVFSHVVSNCPPPLRNEARESHQALKSPLKLFGRGKPPSLVIKPVSKRGAWVCRSICRPFGVSTPESVPLYSTPIRPGMTSPTLRPVLAKTQRSSGASADTKTSPFVGTLFTQLPPTNDCSGLPIQVKVHVFSAHVRLVGQSLSTLQCVVLAGEHTPFPHVRLVGQSLSELHGVLVAVAHVPLP